MLNWRAARKAENVTAARLSISRRNFLCGSLLAGVVALSPLESALAAFDPGTYQLVNLDPTGIFRQGLTDCTAGLQAIISKALAAPIQPVFFAPAGVFKVTCTVGAPTIFNMVMTTGANAQLGCQFIGAGDQSTLFLVTSGLSGAPYLPLTEAQFQDYATYPDDSRSAFMRVKFSAGTVISGFSVRKASGSAQDVCYGLRLGGHPSGITQTGNIGDLKLFLGNASFSVGNDCYGFTVDNLSCVSSIGEGGVARFDGQQAVNFKFNTCTFQAGTDTKDAIVLLENGASALSLDTCTLLAFGANGVDVPTKSQWAVQMLGSFAPRVQISNGTIFGPWVRAQNQARLIMREVQCQFSDALALGTAAITVSDCGSGLDVEDCYRFGSFTKALLHKVATGDVSLLTAADPVKAWNSQGVAAWSDSQPALNWKRMSGLGDLIYNGGVAPSVVSGDHFPLNGDTFNTWVNTNRLENLLDSKNPELEQLAYKVNLRGVPGLVITNPSVGWAVGKPSFARRLCNYVTTPTVGAGVSQLSRYFECQAYENMILRLAYCVLATSALVPATADANADIFVLKWTFLNSSGASVGTGGIGSVGKVMNDGGGWNYTTSGSPDRIVDISGTGNWQDFQTLMICPPQGSVGCRVDVMFQVNEAGNDGKYEISCLEPEAFPGPYTGVMENRPLESRFVCLVADTPPVVANYTFAPNDVVWNRNVASGAIMFWTLNAAGTAWVASRTWP